MFLVKPRRNEWGLLHDSGLMYRPFSRRDVLTE